VSAHSGDYATALEQRVLARRALDEAEDAAERLRTARDRARTLLREAGVGGGSESARTLQARMRLIESRMIATDQMMRSAEHALAGLLDEPLSAMEGSPGTPPEMPPEMPPEGPLDAPPARPTAEPDGASPHGASDGEPSDDSARPNPPSAHRS